MKRPKPIICEGLGVRKTQLLDRLSNSGKFLVTPLVEDEFSQMSVAECRSFVVEVENFLRRSIQKMT